MYLGLLENVRVRRAGFAFRMPFDRFLQRSVTILFFCFQQYSIVYMVSDSYITQAHTLTHTHTHTHTQSCIHTHLNTCTHINTHINTHTIMHTLKHMHTHTQTHTHTQSHASTRTYLNTCTYTNTYTTQTHTHNVCSPNEHLTVSAKVRTACDHVFSVIRYKCIAPDTWPNYRGNVVDGVRHLVSSQGYSKDVEFGRSKLFIRSPQTLFAFEEARDARIPSIVLLMQKVSNWCWCCRGVERGRGWWRTLTPEMAG